MEHFIQYKDRLITKYEWDRGDVVDDKTNKARWKLVNKGSADIVDESFFSLKGQQTVKRKGMF